MLGHLVVLIVTFQWIQGVDSVSHPTDFNVETIQVVSGKIAIDEYLERKAKALISNTNKMRNIDLSWVPKIIGNKQDVHSAVRDLDEDFEFSESMEDMSASFTRINDYHNRILNQKSSMEKEINMTPRKLQTYKTYAGRIIEYLTKKNPLLKINQIFRNIFQEYTSYQTERLLQNQEFGSTCSTRLSPLQVTSQLLGRVIWSSWLYYYTLLISHEILDDPKLKSDGKDPALKYRYDISGWYNETIATIKPALSRISRKLYACGLPHASDLSIELKVQAKIFIRVCNKYSTPDRHQCADVIQAKKCSAIEANTVCSISRPCSGKLQECKLLNDPNAEVCISDSSRDPRYQYYKTSRSSTRITSIDDKCHIRSLDKTEYRGNLDLPFIAHTGRGKICTSCLCACQEGEYFINLASAYSDVFSNMIITGAKFVLKDNVLELHIQQAKVLPDGLVDYDAQWVGPQWEAFQPVSRNEANNISLFTTTLPPGRVLTGLKLEYGPANDFKDHGWYIILRLFSSEYDYKQGRVAKDKPRIEALPTPFPERELHVDDLISPRKVRRDNEEFIVNNARVTFGISNDADGGQSTIPFFDGQEVTSSSPTPLAGAGLYYKGGEDWAGYIGIELHTYQTAKFIVGDPDAK
ncbi:hypothetical protein QAD02_005813 [Eretmocerus hayati]|uniref:Uncharacterized protein n=1 Tax=Eretmocerus hayati TaxID=131215 RepID=A0ACC2NUP6_9HYME|nr:hypothetical protein QAD02_005813 [Eretmocerus hayati]